MTDFRHAHCKGHLQRLDEWIRRKLRCLRLKQCKRPKAIADFLQGLGVPQWRAWMLALTGQGRWRMALSYQATGAMALAWFKQQGLVPDCAARARGPVQIQRPPSTSSSTPVSIEASSEAR